LHLPSKPEDHTFQLLLSIQLPSISRVSECKRPLWRYRLTWEDYFKINHKEIGLVGVNCEGCPKSKVTQITKKLCCTHPAPCISYHLFGPLKKRLSLWHVTSDEEIHCEICSWLMGLDTDFFCSGMGNLVKHWNKFRNKYGDYVEK
jgi:hypothetical protein